MGQCPKNLTTTRGLIALHAAYGNTEAAVLYAIDADGVATTTQDSEIWAQRNVAGVWQTPVRISNNSEADSSPRIAYDAANQPVLVWLRTNAEGQTFLMLQRGWGGAASATLLDGPAAPAALRDVAVNANGDIVALWTAAYQSFDLQSDLTYAVFHAATNTWSAPLRLTNDAAQDDFANVAWKSANEFNVLYDRAALQTLTTTVMIDGAAKPVTYTVAVRTATTMHVFMPLPPRNPPCSPAVCSSTPTMLLPMCPPLWSRRCKTSVIYPPATCKWCWG